MESGFSPLDEELQLLPGKLTPLVAEGLVRLGTWMPFGRSAGELEYFLHVTVSEAKVRRDTERAGAAYVAVQEAEVKHIEHDLPPAPVGVERQLLSVDGAFVPVVGGEWTEVKTLCLGQVQQPDAAGEVHTTDLSYFSRMSQASDFAHQALVETHRRGVETSRQVCAVTDGAEWIQGFVDWHRADAVRILDFCHAAEYVAAAGRAVYGEDTPAFQAWFAAQRHELKDGDPDRVLAALEQLRVAAQPSARQAIETSLGYLRARRDRIAYAAFQQAGYPIGSGGGEACHKIVIEARMKGAGMHWARSHVNPMAALRNLVCNDRWNEGWMQLAAYLRAKRPSVPEPAPPPPDPNTIPANAAPPQHSLLPTSFKLRPPPPWGRRPVGKALMCHSDEWHSAKQ